MQSLSLIQQQKLQQKLSPAQIQVVRMLELPASELMQRVNEELQDNPALEEEDSLMPTTSDEYETPRSQEEDEFQNPLQNDDFNYDDYISDDETPEYRMHDYAAPAEEENRDIPFSAGTSFGEYLKSQVYLTNMDKTDRHVAKFVVGNIDEDGYLRRSAEELVDDLAFREGIIVSDEKMADIIAQIKTFDPPGVGAKDLCECLLLQLRQKESSASIETFTVPAMTSAHVP